MKILLIRAPLEFPAALGRPDISFNVPVGLLSIASVLEQKGYSPEVFDSLVYGGKEYYEGDTLRFGASYEQIQQEIERRRPDVVGIGSHYTTQLYPTLKTAEIVKRVDPNIVVAVFFMIGFPGERKENIKRTLEFALMLNMKYDVIPGFSIARPYYDTEMYEIAKSKGYLLKEPTPENLSLIERYEQYGENNLIKTPDFTPEELKRYRKTFYRKLLLVQILKPKYYFKSFLRSPMIYLRLARKIGENV